MTFCCERIVASNRISQSAGSYPYQFRQVRIALTFQLDLPRWIDENDPPQTSPNAG